MPSYITRPFLIHQGLIAHTVVLPEGNSICLQLYGRGNITGTNLLFGNSVEFEKKSRFSYTLTQVSGCLFYAADLEALFLKNTEFARLFQKQTGVESLCMMEHGLNMATCSSMEKLRYLCSALEKHQLSISEITHKEIAMLLNMNRVTVTKAMKLLLQGE